MDTKKVSPKAAQKKATDGAARNELHALANIVGAIAVATFEGYEADAGLAFVADRLRVLAGADKL